MLTENFLAEVIRVLIYSRHILAISYVIGYFIVDEGEALNHKHMQVKYSVVRWNFGEKNVIVLPPYFCHQKPVTTVHGSI